jgi:hypothetical protein
MCFMIILLQPVILVVILILRTARVSLSVFTFLNAVDLAFYPYLAETSVTSGRVVVCIK